MPVNYIIRHTSGVDRSLLEVLDSKGNVCFEVKGAMSMTAAGAFIKSMEREEDDCIRIAMQHTQNGP